MRTDPGFKTNQQLHQQTTSKKKAIFRNQHETANITFLQNSGRFFSPNLYQTNLMQNMTRISSESTLNNQHLQGSEEARYNLATRIMSNGVGVIIAGDKNFKVASRPNILRVLPKLTSKPMTLAPSTLQDQMVLVVPSNARENYTISINPNQFITKTCLTTYTHRTTYLQNGTTTIKSHEKVISNTATEERSHFEISPAEALTVTLSKTSDIAIGIFHTTYTYLNTILDGDLPIVISSQHTLTNTITGPDDYISFLQPSEEATPIFETNTYFTKISLTKTLRESDIGKLVSASNILTQVIITESLPPRNTPVVTSYIATVIDKNSSPNLSTEVKSNDQIADIVITPSKTEIPSPANENHITTVEKSDFSISILTAKITASSNSESLQTSLHIYATKTYLTTFTYFTTLVNTQGNSASPTVVNFHTRVIENVITESIPSFLINALLVSKFKSKLSEPAVQNKYVTLMTLPSGQPLEITAINYIYTTDTLSNSQNNIENNTTQISTTKINSSTSTKSTFQSVHHVEVGENSSEVFDSEVASSENDEFLMDQFADPYLKNHTKIENDFPSVNHLIGAINFSRLQALGPVFNAMAGLIQNSFGPSLNNKIQKNITDINTESKHSAKNISAYEGIQVQDGPIYIPVQNLQDDKQNGEIRNPKLPYQPTRQDLHVSTTNTEWLQHVKVNTNDKIELIPLKPMYELPLLNGGIAISPGEVITANSDVIVGKPNGIELRIPFTKEQTSAIEVSLKPPLLGQFPYQHQMPAKQDFNQIPLKQNHKNIVSFDQILKPPPMLKPFPSQYQQQEVKKPIIPNAFNPNYRAYFSNGHVYQTEHPHMQQKHLPHQLPIKNLRLTNFRHQQSYPPHRQLVQQHQKYQRPVSSIFPTNNNVRSVFQKPNYVPYIPYHESPKKQSQPNKMASNEILEIKQIPEIFSTNLPGADLDSASTSHRLDNAVYKTHIINVLHTKKPTLVNLQPSQITNIVIPPERTASLLIMESGVELHRNGQYYNEPSTYTYSEDSTNSHSKRKPISSNQQINLDTNVLNHNIDINVPPITFNKETDFPDSQPVRGQIYSNGQVKYQMSHVTIPLTDNQIQVSLTPQNIVTPKLSGKFPIISNDLVKGSYSGTRINLHNIEPIRDSKIYILTRANSTQKKMEALITAPIATGLPESSKLIPPGYTKESSPHHSILNQNKLKSTFQTISPNNDSPSFSENVFHHQVQNSQSSNGAKPIILPSSYDLKEDEVDDLSAEFSQGLPSSKRTESFWHSHWSHHINRDKDILGEHIGTINRTKNTSAFQFTQKPQREQTSKPALSKKQTLKKKKNETAASLETIESLDTISVNAVNSMSDWVTSTVPTSSPMAHSSTYKTFPGKAFASIDMTTKSPGKNYPNIKLFANAGQGFKQQTERQQHESNSIRNYMSNKLQNKSIESDKAQMKNTNLALETVSSWINFNESFNPLQHEFVYLTSDDGGISFKSDISTITEQEVQKNTLTPTNSIVVSTHPSLLNNIMDNVVTNLPILPITLPDEHLSKTKQTENSFISTLIDPDGSLFKGNQIIIKTSPHSRYNLNKSQTFIKPTTSIKGKTFISSSTVLRIAGVIPSYKKNSSIENNSHFPSITRNPAAGVFNIIDGPQQKYKPNQTSAYIRDQNQNSYLVSMVTTESQLVNDIIIQGSEEEFRYLSSINNHVNQTDLITMTEQLSVPTSNLSSRTILSSKNVTNSNIFWVPTTKVTSPTSSGIPLRSIFTLNKNTTSTPFDITIETQTLSQSTLVVKNQNTTPKRLHFTNFMPLGTTQTAEPVDYSTKIIKKPKEHMVNYTDQFLLTDANPSMEQNSIFVVMTDKNNNGEVLNINPSTIDTADNITWSILDHRDENSIEINYENDIELDLPSRSDDNEDNKFNHVLLGGVLIATPPKVSDNSIRASLTACMPSCKASRNELCQSLENQMACVCRPGFARMFPDRPCRPTYTYTMQIPIYRVHKRLVHFQEQYHSKDSDEFKQISDIIHNAVDRMIMQSDLRDVYHGVHLTSLDIADTDNGIIGKFLIQLSDNSNENRLVDVFKKYLRQNNYSLGGTDIFTSVNGLNFLEITDFNECANNQFHDCSENSRCFNLQGSYTCSCQEGFADLSENTVYPGRICSAEMIGCEKCHYHGKCVQKYNISLPICECFQWYTGASCQLNLKILLIALIAVGTILSILLLFCVLIAYTRRRNNNKLFTLMSGISIIPPRSSRLSTKKASIDKRAMIKDSSSEASENSVPYVLKNSTEKDQFRNRLNENQFLSRQKFSSKKNTNPYTHPLPNSMQSASETNSKQNYPDQSNRSRTVMIPRAKYYHSITTQPARPEISGHAIHTNEVVHFKPNSVETALPFQPQTYKDINQRSLVCSKGNAVYSMSTGALVSAGFEVSATVGKVTTKQVGSYDGKRELHVEKSNFTEPHLQYRTFDSMTSWLNTMKHSELTAEAQSFDETTFQTPITSIPVAYEKQLSQTNGNDEANTMAERDVGSTFLLPHTHLYKPDRDSEISGFESF